MDRHLADPKDPFFLWYNIIKIIKRCFMRKYFILLLTVYLSIIATFLVFIYSLKYNIILNEIEVKETFLKDVIINLENNIEESIYNYIKNHTFIFKPIKLAIYEKSDSIYSDFENTSTVNSKNFFQKTIEIDDVQYTYYFSIIEYTDFIRTYFDKNVIIKFQNEFYPNIDKSVLSHYKKFSYQNIEYYVFYSGEISKSIFNRYILFFVFINSILFIIILLSLIKINNINLQDMRLLATEFKNIENLELNSTYGKILKDRIYKYLEDIKEKENEIILLKNEIDEIKNKNDSLLNDLIFSINNPLQNLFYLTSTNSINKENILNEIDEINRIINKFKIIYLYESNSNFFKFIDIKKMYNSLSYYLSSIISKKNIILKKSINVKNAYIFSDEEKLFVLLYELSHLIITEKNDGMLTYSFNLVNDVLEIKIIDHDNIFNDYLLMLNKDIFIDKYNFKMYNIALIKRYISDLNGNIFLNISNGNSVIKIELPINYINFFENLDLSKLKNFYITKFIEHKYSVNQANKFIDEIISLYIKVLKYDQESDINTLIFLLKKNKMYILLNWLNYILKNPNDKKLKDTIIKKLEGF
jgi:hypothetical protein